VKVWDALQGQQTLTLKGHRRAVAGVAFSQDGKRLVSGSHDFSVRVWDVVKGQEVVSLRGHQGPVRNVAISPDGKRVVSGSEDRTVMGWEVETGKKLFSLAHGGPVECLAMSPDGKRIATGGLDKMIKVWDAQTGREQSIIKIHNDRITTLSFSPNGKQLLSSSWDSLGKPSEVKIWDLEGGGVLLALIGVEANCTCFSPDGRHIVTGGRSVRDARTGKILVTLKGRTQHGADSVCYSPDGTRLVTCSRYEKTVTVWDASRGEELFIFKEQTAVNCVAFSPDGQRLACATGDEQKAAQPGEVKVWEATHGPEYLSFEHTGWVLRIA